MTIRETIARMWSNIGETEEESAKVADEFVRVVETLSYMEGDEKIIETVRNLQKEFWRTLNPVGMYFNWEGRSFTPSDYKNRIKDCIDKMGREGPFFVGIGEVGAWISKDPNALHAIERHRGEYVEVSIDECLFEGGDLEAAADWVEVIKILAQGQEDEYYNEALSVAQGL